MNKVSQKKPDVMIMGAEKLCIFLKGQDLRRTPERSQARFDRTCVRAASFPDEPWVEQFQSRGKGKGSASKGPKGPGRKAKASRGR